MGDVDVRRAITVFECRHDVVEAMRRIGGNAQDSARSLVSSKATCGKHVEEGTHVEDVLSWGEGVCEDKPLRLVIGESPRTFSQVTSVHGSSR